MWLVRSLCLGPVCLVSACFHDDRPGALGSSTGSSKGSSAAIDGSTTSSGEVTSSGGDVDTSSGDVDTSSGAASSSGCSESAWYGDKDMDGHGDPADVVMACEKPGDRVAVGDDCDDADAGRSPDVVELCDDKDNDCDSLVDESSAMNTSCKGCTLYARGASSYAFCIEQIGWEAARGECALRGGDLAVIEDAEENDAIAGQLAGIKESVGQWAIGLNDRAVEGSHVWLDGRPAMYTRWAAGEPNDFEGLEDCAVLYDLGEWNDLPCGQLRPFLCESPAP